MSRVEVIGDATLYLGDCLALLPTLSKVDAVITDPPYSARTHAGHDGGAVPADRAALGYAFLGESDILTLGYHYTNKCDGVVARTKAQIKWGTLPGGYIAGPGWNDKARMGGKPTALMESLVLDYSRLGDTVLDSHMGAGTTGIACIRTGRKFIGIEVDPEAFDLSCQRIDLAWKQRPLFDAGPARKPEQLGFEQ